MITVIIKDNGEPNVTRFTRENIARELLGVQGVNIVIAKDWFKAFQHVKTPFVCFVEADCVVSSGYFTSQIGILKKDNTLRNLAILGSALGVLHWGDRVYGYSLGKLQSDGFVPNKLQVSMTVSPVQVAYLPGAILRTKALRALSDLEDTLATENLVELSTVLSLCFWSGANEPRVAINPNVTYVSTEAYVGEPAHPDIDVGDAIAKFTKAGLR
jgi:hypothetical protein